MNSTHNHESEGEHEIPRQITAITESYRQQLHVHVVKEWHSKICLLVFQNCIPTQQQHYTTNDACNSNVLFILCTYVHRHYVKAIKYCCNETACYDELNMNDGESI